jgi:hypothetical protein
VFERVLKGFGSAAKWLVEPEAKPNDPRRALRFPSPEVVVYYRDGSTPEGHRLRDISETGAFVCTQERWYNGGIVRLILQGYKTGPHPEGTVTSDSVCTPSRVVHHGVDGVGVEFLFSSQDQQDAVRRFIATIPVQLPPAHALALKDSSGQSLVEFSLILPLIFLLVMNLVNLGGFFFAWITLAGAARAGAQYMAMGTASVGNPSTPTAGQVTTLVTNDISSLLNRSSLVVRVCTNNNGTISCTGSGSSTPPADPEPASFILGSVDTTYTYQPFISQWNFSAIGIHLTLPPTTIHQRAVARIMQ